MPPKQLHYRTRLFLILFLFALVPTALLTVLWGVTIRSTLPIVTGRAGWDSVAATGRRAIAAAELAETVEVLATETERLERTARSFAQFGRLPEGPASRIDLGELVRYATTATVPPTMTLSLNVAEDLPMILGYHDALSGAVSNVLLNAVDACNGAGKLTVTVAASTLNTRDAVLISIEDNGPGIGSQQLKRIWEPYVTNKAGGTGLGLAIARQAVWAHDGSVSAHSTVGSGTKIEFTIPIGSANAGEGRA